MKITSLEKRTECVTSNERKLFKTKFHTQTRSEQNLPHILSVDQPNQHKDVQKILTKNKIWQSNLTPSLTIITFVAGCWTSEIFGCLTPKIFVNIDKSFLKIYNMSNIQN